MELETFFRQLKMSELWMGYLLSLKGWDIFFYDRQKLMSLSNTETLEDEGMFYTLALDLEFCPLAY